MKRKRDILFVIYIVVVIILAVIYFTVPEREVFIENQLQRWREFLELVRSFI